MDSFGKQADLICSILDLGERLHTCIRIVDGKPTIKSEEDINAPQFWLF